MSTRSLSQVQAASKPSFTPVGSGLLQRKCACGKSSGLTGECSECQSKGLTLQRRSANQAEPDEVPPIVHEVLRSPIQLLVKPRPAHDFGHLRVTVPAGKAVSSENHEGQALVRALGTLTGRQIERMPEDIANADSAMGMRTRAEAFTKGWNSLGAGEPLTADIRTRYEQSYKSDFSQVRIHNGCSSAALAEIVGARAFTLGNRIVFNSGQYQPNSREGQFILGHELAHVVQQGHSTQIRQRTSLTVSQPNSAAEKEADRAATAALDGRVFTPMLSAEADVMTFPWLLLAAALVIAGATVALSPSTEENRETIGSDSERLINTGWVYVPAVGPLIQISQARSGLERGLGVLFFTADVLTAGMAGSAFLKLSQVGMASLRMAAPASVRQLTEAGLRSVTQAEAEQTVMTALRSGQAVVGAEGALNHSVIYVMNEGGQILKLHGGISSFMTRNVISPEAARFSLNAFQVVERQGINMSLIEASEVIKSRGLVMLRGCAGTQCLLLERAGLQAWAPQGASRLIPATVIAHQAAAEGSIQVVSNLRMWTGTAIQFSLVGAIETAAARGGTFWVVLQEPDASAPPFGFRGSSTRQGSGAAIPRFEQVSHIRQRARQIIQIYGRNPQGAALSEMIRGIGSFMAPYDLTNVSVISELRQALIDEGMNELAAEALARDLAGVSQAP